MVVEASCTPLLFAERNSTAPETPQPYPEYCWGCPSTTCHTSLRWCYSSGPERNYRARTSDRTLLSKTWWFPCTDSCGSTNQRNQISQERYISMGALTNKKFKKNMSLLPSGHVVDDGAGSDTVGPCRRTPSSERAASRCGLMR